MMYHDFLIAPSISYASSALGMVQERGAFSQELVILIILVVIALALILVCGLMGRRETDLGTVEMGPSETQPLAPEKAEAASWQAGPAAQKETAGVAERGAAAVVQQPVAPAEPVAEVATAVVAEEPVTPAESVIEAAESLTVEEAAMPVETFAGVAEPVVAEERGEPVAEVAETVVAEEPTAPAETVAEATETPETPEAVAAPPRPDDLKVIEGIGPKVARLLNEAGIFTFAQLAEADPAHLKQILEAARLQMMDPASWPDQARLAAAGDWEALKQMQDTLKGGRR